MDLTKWNACPRHGLRYIASSCRITSFAPEYVTARSACQPHIPPVPGPPPEPPLGKCPADAIAGALGTGQSCAHGDAARDRRWHKRNNRPPAGDHANWYSLKNPAYGGFSTPARWSAVDLPYPPPRRTSAATRTAMMCGCGLRCHSTTYWAGSQKRGDRVRQWARADSAPPARAPPAIERLRGRADLVFNRPSGRRRFGVRSCRPASPEGSIPDLHRE